MRVAIVSDDTILSMLLSNDSQQCVSSNVDRMLTSVAIIKFSSPLGELWVFCSHLYLVY